MEPFACGNKFWHESGSFDALNFLPRAPPPHQFTPPVPVDEESATPEAGAPDDTETDTKAAVDEEDQVPADEDAAPAPAPDSPVSPATEEEAEATAVEAVPEPAAAPDIKDAVVEVAAPVELDEVSATGEWWEGIRWPWVLTPIFVGM